MVACIALRSMSQAEFPWSIDRRMATFTTHPSRLGIKELLSVPGRDVLDRLPTMDGNVVHVISSYDLRSMCVVRMRMVGLGIFTVLLQDSIKICTVSEWTGYTR